MRVGLLQLPGEGSINSEIGKVGNEEREGCRL